jgi:hypothetical protein
MPRPAHRFREEVPNVLLAQLLSERGVVSAPESIESWRGRGKRLPDVLVVYQGLRTVLEGKFGDQSRARDAALAAAQRRVEEGIAHIGMGVIYPPSIRSARSLSDLREELKEAQLEVSLCTEAGTQGWTQANVGGLSELLRRTFEHLVREDVVTQAVEELDAGVSDFARVTAERDAVLMRWMETLGIGHDLDDDESDE